MSAERLKGTTDTVRMILESIPKARDDDNFLYYMVLSVYGEKNGIDIDSMSMPRFLLNMRKYGFPPFESVRRSRQKIQHDHPELAGTKTVQGMRKLEEETYRSYALKKGTDNMSARRAAIRKGGE